ncbi:MAG TPA: RNA polymerase sigma factor [Pyrinomonadaceae bacterium]|nr:RNA polymerase sigma factor [Pyrinomonadaceae bacterium]
MDDSAALKKCLDGDKESFRFLVERYQHQAIGHATAVLGNREDALDAVQEAFIDAYRAIDGFDFSRRFYPWFYVLLRNRCFKMLASPGRRNAASADETEILAPRFESSIEETLSLEAALLDLTPEDRELVTLKYLDGLSYQELAELLQIPKGTVMSRLFYARRQLQAKLT